MVKIVVMISLLLAPFQLFSQEFIIGLNERDIYRYKNEQGQWAGKDIALIKAVFRRTPFKYRIVSMPWARVINELKAGTIDMTLAATALPERKKYALFTKNNFRQKSFFFEWDGAEGGPYNNTYCSVFLLTVATI